MVANNPTAGFVLFLIVLSMPLLAVTLPFVLSWYQRNQIRVDARITSVVNFIKEQNARRNTTYVSPGRSHSEE